jgi:glycosyltransferase involved in cell wall biosynthesis
MKVLMISTDKKILEEGSEVQQRMVDYGRLTNELYIVVFNTSHNADEEAEEKDFGNVFVYPTNSRNRLWRIWDAVKICRTIIVNCKLKIENSVITTQDPFETGIVGWYLKLRHHIPLQIQMHTDFFSPHFSSESFLNRLRVRIARFVIPRADCLRAVSERVRDRVISELGLHATNIAILPVFVDIKKIKNAPVRMDLHKKYPQFEFLLLTAARLEREKDIDKLICAMKDIAEKRMSVGLVIVGGGGEENKLKALVAELNLSGIVYFEPWNRDLVSYYKTADAFVLNSRYEGYGRTVVEAMAADCPVIMTDVGLAGEMVVDGVSGLVVPVGDKDALREAIMRLVASPTLGERLRRNAVASIFGLPDKETYLARYRAGWLSCLE